MIRIVIKYDSISQDRIAHSIHITGHAPKTGDTHVSLSCAAVSSLCIAFIEYIATNDLARFIQVYTSGPGDLMIDAKNDEFLIQETNQSIAYKGALDMFLHGLTRLSNVYKKHIAIDAKIDLLS